MGNKLYVGNLSYNAADTDLAAAFEQHGEITEAKIIYDRETNRSKGFGFVTFATDEAAQTALTELNGTEFMGRNLNVKEAEERQPRRNEGRSNNYRGNARY